MIRTALAVFIAALLVLTSGLGAAARACGTEPASTPVASHCAEMTTHAGAPEPDRDDVERDAACKAACALASVTAGEIAPTLAAVPNDWTAAPHNLVSSAAPSSAPLFTEDPPPRSLA